jgi:hypothetical protein
MRKIFLLVFTLLQISIAHSQTNIEVIRASSYYSNAVTHYIDGNYASTLKSLHLAEKNLKGKTNRDLEYLKIMSHYHSKNYKQAYQLAKTYFDGGFFERKKAFVNIATYDKIKFINYEEELTVLFVNLEQRSNSNVLEKTDNLIAQIVSKIENEKITFSNYINTALLPKATEKIDYCLREFSNGSMKRVYENNFLNLKMTPTNNKYVFNYSGAISGRAINTSTYRINVTFAPTKTELNRSSYSYGYMQGKVSYVSGNITLNTTAYQCYSLTAPKRESSYFSNLLVQNFQNKSFTRKGFRTKNYKITFNENEENFLKQGANFTKLSNALRSKGLL